jgi:hypothetical protein
MVAGAPKIERFLTIDKIKELVDKIDAEARTSALVATVYSGLEPGFMYLLRIRGCNRAGRLPELVMIV